MDPDLMQQLMRSVGDSDAPEAAQLREALGAVREVAAQRRGRPLDRADIEQVSASLQAEGFSGAFVVQLEDLLREWERRGFLRHLRRQAAQAFRVIDMAKMAGDAGKAALYNKLYGLCTEERPGGSVLQLVVVEERLAGVDAFLQALGVDDAGPRERTLQLLRESGNAEPVVMALRDLLRPTFGCQRMVEQASAESGLPGLTPERFQRLMEAAGQGALGALGDLGGGGDPPGAP